MYHFFGLLFSLGCDVAYGYLHQIPYGNKPKPIQRPPKSVPLGIASTPPTNSGSSTPLQQEPSPSPSTEVLQTTQETAPSTESTQPLSFTTPQTVPVVDYPLVTPQSFFVFANSSIPISTQNFIVGLNSATAEF